MNAIPAKKVVIAGRDAAAWLSALALLRAFGAHGVTVEVIELPGLFRPGDVLLSHSGLQPFHTLLGLDEHAVLKATSGVYSLGQSFTNFAHARPAFLRPHGSHGMPLAGCDFHQLWVKARGEGMTAAFEDFSLTAVAAKQARFFTPDANTRAVARCDYGYHLRATPYVQVLKSQAVSLGAQVTAARDVRAEIDPASGHITALRTGDGRTVTGDLYIDATGPDSLLLGQGLNIPVDSWAQWSPVNRLLALAGERLETLPSHSQVRAQNGGCLHLAPAQDMTGIVFAYDGNRVDDDEAYRTAAITAGVKVKGDATVSSLAPGRRTLAWAGNCVAIGEAACVFDPIENPALLAIQLGLAHLIARFPGSGDMPARNMPARNMPASNMAAKADAYNRSIADAFDTVRDFQTAHYALNRLQDVPLWDGLRDMPLPTGLADRIATFQANGALALSQHDSFQMDDWLSLFIGHGLIPRNHDPRADRIPRDDTIRHFQGNLKFIRESVEEMSSHKAYIEMFASRDFG